MRVLTFLLILFGLFASAGAQERYVDGQHKFSLLIPSGWQRAEDPNYALTLTRGPVNLKIMALQGLTLEGSVQKLNEKYRSLGAKVVEEKAFTISEVPAHYSSWASGDESLISIVAVSGRESFVFLGLFPPGSTRQDVLDVVSIVKTFQVVRDAPAAAQNPAGETPPDPRDWEDELWDGFGGD